LFHFYPIFLNAVQSISRQDPGFSGNRLSNRICSSLSAVGCELANSTDSPVGGIVVVQESGAWGVAFSTSSMHVFLFYCVPLVSTDATDIIPPSAPIVRA
jgi:hypothetical protein